MPRFKMRPCMCTVGSCGRLQLSACSLDSADTHDESERKVDIIWQAAANKTADWSIETMS